jgi:phosphoribosylformylglycinamidine cyclo-ligase
VVKNTPFAVPPLFAEIQRASGASWHEMYRVFNMGHRLELYVPPAVVPQVLAVAAGFNLGAQVVGYTEAHTGKEVVVHGPEGVLKY